MGGKELMFESPLLQKMIAERVQDLILVLLKYRLGPVPRKVTKHLRAIMDEKRLGKLPLLSVKCSDLAAFSKALFA
jgi:hypothetical protein